MYQSGFSRETEPVEIYLYLYIVYTYTHIQTHNIQTHISICTKRYTHTHTHIFEEICLRGLVFMFTGLADLKPVRQASKLNTRARITAVVLRQNLLSYGKSQFVFVRP